MAAYRSRVAFERTKDDELASVARQTGEADWLILDSSGSFPSLRQTP